MGVVTCHMSSDTRSENSRRVSSILPRASCTVTHLVMSCRFDLMPAAAAHVSSRVAWIGFSSPSRRHPRECGEATLSAGVRPTLLMRLALIPSGAKIRSRMTSSHVLPVAEAITWPATTNMRLLYAYRLRKLDAGGMDRAAATTWSRDTVVSGQNRRSPAPSPSPLR